MQKKREKKHLQSYYTPPLDSQSSPKKSIFSIHNNYYMLKYYYMYVEIIIHAVT